MTVNNLLPERLIGKFQSIRSSSIQIAKDSYILKHYRLNNIAFNIIVNMKAEKRIDMTKLFISIAF